MRNELIKKKKTWTCKINKKRTCKINKGKIKKKNWINKINKRSVKWEKNYIKWEIQITRWNEIRKLTITNESVNCKKLKWNKWIIKENISSKRRAYMEVKREILSKKTVRRTLAEEKRHLDNIKQDWN